MYLKKKKRKISKLFPTQLKSAYDFCSSACVSIRSHSNFYTYISIAAKFVYVIEVYCGVFPIEAAYIAHLQRNTTEFGYVTVYMRKLYWGEGEVGLLI